MAIVEVDMAKLVSQLVLKVKVRRITRVRMWIGSKAIGLAARIFGCVVEISTGSGEEGESFTPLDPTKPVRPTGGMVKPRSYVISEQAPEAFGHNP